MKTKKLEEQALFALGKIVATQGAMSEIPAEDLLKGIVRHSQGDWGELCAADRQENDFSLKHGYRLLSSYRSAQGIKFWVITEYDRSCTTVLLPSEY
ncbi:MAG: type I restriction endonuclease subunit M [Pirellulaceae bacterium]|nr:type I restriction endonuclease subunit M [Pirellulaceae bacterium]